jgi:quinol monooxygenase YgiN
MTIALVVRFDLPDQETARQFDQLTADAVAQITSKEPGTLMYVTHVLTGEPLSRLFYEVYADEAAFQEHERAPHVRDFHARKNPLLVGEARVEFLTPGPQKGLAS